MAVSQDFLSHVEDLLAPLGPIRSRRMFGGAGVYCGDRFFALIADDRLYFKTDDASRSDCEALGLESFRFRVRGAWRRIRYYPVPDEVLEEPEQLLEWAERALAAA